MATFAELATRPDAPLDELALALAAEFRPVDARRALDQLDELGAELADAAARRARTAAEQAELCGDVLGGLHGFVGDLEEYDHPDNSMMDLVLERRTGLPIVLSAIYAEVARRAGIRLAPIGLPGHFIVGHLGASPPILLDPFSGGGPLDLREDPPDPALIRPWTAHETAMRMLNNLVNSLQRRGDLTGAIRAADLRLMLPAPEPEREALKVERRVLQARLN